MRWQAWPVNRFDMAAGDDFSTQGFEIARQCLGDCVRASARHRPADGVPRRQGQVQKRRGRLIERLNG
jgi:hypothetical protein